MSTDNMADLKEAVKNYLKDGTELTPAQQQALEEFHRLETEKESTWNNVMLRLGPK
jgi:hypothetical protein